MRREQDCIAPSRHADIMVYAPKNDPQPFWFARVLAIIHVNASYRGPGATTHTRKWRRVNMLWVRWFMHDDTVRSGFRHRREPRASFVGMDDPNNEAFGFIDPDTVIRAACIMPYFKYGLTKNLLGRSSLARKNPVEDGDEYNDYRYFKISMCDEFLRGLHRTN